MAHYRILRRASGAFGLKKGRLADSYQLITDSNTFNPIPKSDVEVPADRAPEAVARQKMAELAGMQSLKPMPPAREGTPLHTTTNPQKASSSQRRRRKLENRCAFGFYFFLLSVAAYPTAICLGRFVNRESAGVVVLLVMIPSWIASLTLAIFGWKQLARHPHRYTDTSKLFATITLALGGLAGLVIVPLFIVGFCRGIDHARAEMRHDYAENPPAESPPVEFKNDNFTFHPPGDPWRKVKPQEFGPNVLYALWRPEPMAFTIIQQRQRVGVIVANPRRDMVEVSKISLRRTLASCQIASEKEVTYNGMAGWQIESQGIIQGRDTHLVQWIYATNGFGYLLSAWAPDDAKVQLQVEASQLFSRFELTTPQQVTATPNP